MGTQYLNKHDARNVSVKRNVKEGKRRVAIDVRVSTQHEMQMNALDNQKQWVVKLAEEHEDWIFDPEKDLYVEEGISGTSLKKRPQFSEMIRKAEAGEYDLIVVREVSRFMRNAKLTLGLVDELLNYGVEVYFVNDGIWSRNESDYFKLTIMAQYAEQESRKISERVFSGQAVARENGVLMGNGNILGYDLVKGKKSHQTTYVINPEQAETVRTIYQMALRGNGIKKIRHFLEDNGHKTATGGSKWHNSTIERILRRSTYMGEMEHLQSVTEDPLTHERCRVPKDKHIYIKMNFPKIIEPEVWHAVQEAVDSRICYGFVKNGNEPVKRGKAENKDIYCRKMRCGCGRRFRKDSEKRNGTATYYCYQTVEDGSQKERQKRSQILDDNCSIRGIRDWKMDMVTAKVFEYLNCNISEVRESLLSSINKAYTATPHTGYGSEDLLALDAEIEKLETKNTRLLDFLEDGVIDKETYKQRKEINDTKINNKKKLKQKLESVESDIDEKERTLEVVKVFVNESLDFPKAGGKNAKVPDAMINTYVNSIKACADWVFEYNIRVNPDAEVDIPVIPDSEFNPQVHSAKKFLDNSEAALIAEFTISYEDAKEYANRIGRKVKRAHFDKPITVRVYADI